MRATVCLIAMVAGLGSSGLMAQTSAPVTAIGTSGGTTATVGIASGTVVPTPVLVVTPPAVAPRLDPPGDLRITNLSTRARVTPSNPLVAGFAISGTTARTVLVRAVGPALGGFGVEGVAEAVQLRLHDADGAVVAENAGWDSAPLVPDAIAATGAFPFAAGSADAALVVTLRPGNYSAEVIAADGVGGVALVEVYDVDGLADGSRLRNVSTMGTVATGGGEVISGFVLAGTGTRQYLVRGVGPGLTKLGVAGVLRDPTFTLFNSAGTQLAANDDWSGYAKPGVVMVAVASTSVSGTTNVVPTITRDLVSLATQLTGAFPLDLGSMDAAMVATLGPGAYTVQVRGVGTTVITTASTTTAAPAPTASTAPTGSVAAVAAGAATATAQPVQAISVSFVPSAPGVALLEIYELP